MPKILNSSADDNLNMHGNRSMHHFPQKKKGQSNQMISFIVADNTTVKLSKDKITNCYSYAQIISLGENR